MASPAFKRTAVPAFEPLIASDRRSLSESASSLDKSPVINSEADVPYVETSKGLQAAKGAMVAIGLEAAAALLLYGIWQAWHVLR
jgi:hypothetical protein